ncbi:uncharacterized protein C10orf105 [Amia ocellicauda]|uniref:uncharacterized protein C10orf105 n=1 Tax=Amia ocellicauda TaxID=2972642 RepID=UPI0034639B6C
MSALVNSSTDSLQTLLPGSSLPALSTLSTPVTALPAPSSPLPVIVAVLCLFLLFSSCAAFLALCRPARLGGAGRREGLPYHCADASEPQLRLWKRLGSLRQSLSSFRRMQRPPPPRRSPGAAQPCLDSSQI